MDTSYITDYYNNYNEDERTKSRHGSVEFATNMRYIRRYVPQGAKILDVGAGTGVYSMALAMDGYDVHAVELVEHNIEVFRENLRACGAEIPVEQGNALDLSRFGDESFDAALLFGPLYHLYEREDKLTVLREAGGIPLVIAVWTLALAGTVLTITKLAIPRWLTSAIYLFMGWLAIFAIVPIYRALPPAGFFWLLTGGLLYTVGGVLYAVKWPGRDNPRFGCHEIFHLFILLGSVAHFVMMDRVVLWL